MKVLEINTEKGWRGGERQTLYTLEALRTKGVEVDLLCLRGSPLYERAMKLELKDSDRPENRYGCRGSETKGFFDAGIEDSPGTKSCDLPQHATQGSIDSHPRKLEEGNATKSEKYRRIRAEFCKEEQHPGSDTLHGKVYGARNNLDAFLFLLKNGRRYDLIHCQTARAQTLAVVSKPFYRKPVVYTRRVDFKPSGFFSRIKYRFTDRVVAISERIKLIIAEAGLKPLEQIKVIPSAVKQRQLNRERAIKLKQVLGIGNKKIIATVGALVSHKDPFTMIEAVKLLSQRRDDFVFLHFGDGWLRDAMEKQIRKQGLIGKYILVGFEDDVEDFFSIMDVFVMSSRQEGLGSAVLDAFTYRVPVVSTDAGGLKETVEGRGIVCRVGDATCLAHCIAEVLDNDDLRRRIVDKAYSDVKTYYSVEKMTADYIRVFSLLVVEKGKPKMQEPQ